MCGMRDIKEGSLAESVRACTPRLSLAAGFKLCSEAKYCTQHLCNIPINEGHLPETGCLRSAESWMSPLRAPKKYDKNSFS